MINNCRFASHRLDGIQKYTQSKKIEGYKYMALVFDELEDSYIGKTVSCCSVTIRMLLATTARQLSLKAGHVSFTTSSALFLFYK